MSMVLYRLHHFINCVFSIIRFVMYSYHHVFHIITRKQADDNIKQNLWISAKNSNNNKVNERKLRFPKFALIGGPTTFNFFTLKCPFYVVGAVLLILCFRNRIRLFWNHTLTWVSVKFSAMASCRLSSPATYCCLSNAFSSLCSWNGVKIVRDLLFPFRGRTLPIVLPRQPVKYTQNST